jgi:hypothetical protein
MANLSNAGLSGSGFKGLSHKPSERLKSALLCVQFVQKARLTEWGKSGIPGPDQYSQHCPPVVIFESLARTWPVKM